MTKNWFSEKELPKTLVEGKLLIVGRSDGGLEMATVLDINRPETWETVITGFLDCLKDMGNDGKIWLQ